MKLWYPSFSGAFTFIVSLVFWCLAGEVYAEEQQDTSSGASYDVLTEEQMQQKQVQQQQQQQEQASTKGSVKLLDTLIIQGLNVAQEHVVRNIVLFREGQEVRVQDVAESIRLLYATGSFRSVDFFIESESEKSVRLLLKVEEFPICEGVEYSGNRKLKDKDFEEKVAVKKGQVISDAAIYDLVVKMKRMYAEKGYNLAEISHKLVPTKIPGNAFLQFSIKEGPRVRIKEITFSGNREVKTSRLERKLKTKENRWWRSGEFDKELFKEHLDTLILFYNELGYLDASIVKDSVYHGEIKSDLFVNIQIDEGKKYYAGDFFFTGNRVITTDSLNSRISLKKGKPFQKSRYEMSKYLVENVYREEGYLWVYVDEKRNFRGDTIDVTFQITEGRAAVVRKIDISGNTKTLDKVIRREIDLFPGKKYKQSLMMRSRQNIMALNFFSDVKPDLVPNEDGTIDLVFAITEKENIGQLQLGAAYSGQQGGFIGTFSTRIPNFRGTGQELAVGVEAGGRTQNYNLSFTEPWAFDRPLSLSGLLYYAHTEYLYVDEEYENYGFRVGVGRQELKWPDDKFRVTGGYGFSYFESSIQGEDFPEYDLKILKKGWKSSFELGVKRYDLDVPLFPTEGSLFSVDGEYVGFGVGMQFNYLKATASYQHYFPLPLKFVLGSRTTAGVISGLGGTVKISHQDLFRLGGVYTSDSELRGYEEGEFGGYSSTPQRGLTMFASTLELRYPLLDQQLYLGLFADVGNTWGSVSEMNLGDLYKGVGAGVRINVPMLGILGFDLGWGLDDVKNGWTKRKPKGFQFHFLMNKGF
ncbi:MAG: outer membrane protein assembly factor BamA [Chitinispirillaceae bacterium]|nr:outer membrane protein assembly factor BamA [Chitinispirillaceae bacterium]